MSEAKALVLYHGGCRDGWAAAWAAWMRLGDEAEYRAVFHGPGGTYVRVDGVEGRDVYVVDFCYPLETMAAWNARRIVVLDHHKTAVEDYAGKTLPPNVEVTFDMQRSGARLSWDHFHVGVDAPWPILYVEDRDLWRHALPHTHEVSAYLGTIPDEFEAWSELLDASRMQIASTAGTWMLRVRRDYIAAAKGNARRTTFLGHEDVPVVNAIHWAISEVVGELAETAAFAVGWYQRADGLYGYSLRSRGDFDVSAVARTQGGGGHRNAAGFVSAALLA